MLDADHVERRVISAIPVVQAHYEECIRNGCSPTLAEVLATRSFPGVRGTDRSFMQGRHLDGSQFEGTPPGVGRDYVAKALAAGVNPTGKFYSGPLARFPADPRAWIDSLSDVRRIAEERNLSVQGAITREATPADPLPGSSGPYRVADEIVNEHVAQRLASDPDAARRPRDELRHEIATTLAGASGHARPERQTS